MTKKKNKRCAFPGCKKRLTIVDRTLVCRCDKCFCATHRSIVSHGCTYEVTSTKETMNTIPTGVFKKVEVI